MRGDYKPLSDIDIAIVLYRGVDEWTRVRFRKVVRRLSGMVNPFEIHILSWDEWENWYKRFINGWYVRII